MPKFQFVVDLIKWLQSKIASFSFVICNAQCTDIKYCDMCVCVCLHECALCVCVLKYKRNSQNL